MSTKYMKKFVKMLFVFDYFKSIQFDTYSQNDLDSQLIENDLLDFDCLKTTITHLSKKELCMMIEYMFNNFQSDIEDLKTY